MNITKKSGDAVYLLAVLNPNKYAEIAMDVYRCVKGDEEKFYALLKERCYDFLAKLQH